MPKVLPKDTRQRIVATAVALHASAGSEGVSFRRIAQQLGINHMQPYRYFRDKTELLAAMRSLCVEHLLAGIREADPGGDDPLHRLYEITLKMFAHIVRAPNEFRLVFSLSQPPIQPGSELDRSRQALYRYLRAIVQQAIDQERMQGDADARMHLAWATAHGLLTLHLSHQLIHGTSLAALVQPAFEVVFAPIATATEATQSSTENVVSIHRSSHAD